MSKQPGRRRFSREFKLAAVRRMAEGANVSQLARELGISRKGLYEWRDKLSKGGPAALRRAGRPGKSDAALQGEVIEPSTLARQSGGANELARAEAWIAELERTIGQQAVDLDFFGKPCGTSRALVRRAARLAARHLRGHPGDDGVQAARHNRADVQARWYQPGRFTIGTGRSRHPGGRRQGYAMRSSVWRWPIRITAIAGLGCCSAGKAGSPTTSGCCG